MYSLTQRQDESRRVKTSQNHFVSPTQSTAIAKTSWRLMELHMLYPDAPIVGLLDGDQQASPAEV